MTPTDRLRLAFDLVETAEQMLRARLRRERPEATDVELEAAVLAWRSSRPGAEDGDAIGVRVTWPRKR